MILALASIVLALVAGLSLPAAGLAQIGRGSVTAIVNVSQAELSSTTLRSNWPSYNGDYTGRRYSSLTQITPKNVGRLHAQWVFHSRSFSTLESTPIVTDGIMYVTVANDAYALNAVTGNVLWHY